MRYHDTVDHNIHNMIKHKDMQQLIFETHHTNVSHNNIVNNKTIRNTLKSIFVDVLLNNISLMYFRFEKFE